MTGPPGRVGDVVKREQAPLARAERSRRPGTLGARGRVRARQESQQAAQLACDADYFPRHGGPVHGGDDCVADQLTAGWNDEDGTRCGRGHRGGPAPRTAEEHRSTPPRADDDKVGFYLAGRIDQLACRVSEAAQHRRAPASLAHELPCLAQNLLSLGFVVDSRVGLERNDVHDTYVDVIGPHRDSAATVSAR